MTNTVIMRNTETAQTIEITVDKEQNLGRCRGKGNYVIRRTDRKHYRVSTMIPEYKAYKAQGFKVVAIY